MGHLAISETQFNSKRCVQPSIPAVRDHSIKKDDKGRQLDTSQFDPTDSLSFELKVEYYVSTLPRELRLSILKNVVH